MTGPEISHLERRKIEAGLFIPMVQAFRGVIGKKLTSEVAGEVISELARKEGELLARWLGKDLIAMAEVTEIWAGGGSLEIAWIEKSSVKLGFNVTRCRYAEF